MIDILLTHVGCCAIMTIRINENVFSRDERPAFLIIQRGVDDLAVTINDVAKSAGVSIATVSRVINSRGSVNEQLKSKVLMAIKELGYVPNSNAQALKQDCSKLIGITASDLSVSFFPEVVKRVEKEFLSAGYATIVSSTYDQAKIERTILEHMVARRVDALLVNSTGQNEEMLVQIASSGIPVILYDRRTRGHTFPSVYMDKQKAVYQAMEHLYSLGHRRIALVTGPKQLTSNYDRYMGFQGFAFDRGLDPADTRSYFGVFSEEYGGEMMKEIMGMEKRPTAIVTGSISITAGIMKYCRENGLSIPDDMALVSSGNFSFGGAIGMELTYMDDRVEGLSDGIRQLLQQALRGETLSPDHQIVLAPALCVGASTIGKK